VAYRYDGGWGRGKDMDLAMLGGEKSSAGSASLL
jgi:hypothetical protein